MFASIEFTSVPHIECQAKWEERFKYANEKHKTLGCRGVNSFQASDLKGYECVPTPITSPAHCSLFVWISD